MAQLSKVELWAVDEWGFTSEHLPWVAPVAVVLLVVLLYLFLRASVFWISQRLDRQKNGLVSNCLRASQQRLSIWIFFGIAAFSFLRLSPLFHSANSAFEKASFALVLVQLLWIGNVWIRFLVGRVFFKEGEESEFSTQSLAKNLTTVTLAAVWIVAFIFVLDNFGFDVGAVIAGLGVGGIAVGLALQSTLGDIFASFTIQIDKPFQDGDFLIIGEHMGTIESVGLKTTRVRSLGGELLVFPNSVLVSQTIKNYKKMFTRRVLFRVGVEYGTSQEHLEQIPQWIEEIVQGHEICRFDRSHFCEFGESALVVQTVYHVSSPEYLDYAQVHEKVLLEIRKRLLTHKIGFAFPTRTLAPSEELMGALQGNCSAPRPTREQKS